MNDRFLFSVYAWQRTLEVLGAAAPLKRAAGILPVW